MRRHNEGLLPEGEQHNLPRPVISNQGQLLCTPLSGLASGSTTFNRISMSRGSIRMDFNGGRSNHLPSPFVHGLRLDGIPTFFLRTDLGSFMRNLHVGSITSFPTPASTNYGGLPGHAYVPTISMDGIQSRTLGSATGEHPSKRAKAILARPSPSALVGRSKKFPMCMRSIWIPFDIAKLDKYKKDGFDIVVMKVLKLRVLPKTITLPSDTRWGGVYNGEAFLPRTGQAVIAQHCSPKASSPGCFLFKMTLPRITQRTSSWEQHHWSHCTFRNMQNGQIYQGVR